MAPREKVVRTKKKNQKEEKKPSQTRKKTRTTLAESVATETATTEERVIAMAKVAGGIAPLMVLHSNAFLKATTNEKTGVETEATTDEKAGVEMMVMIAEEMTEAAAVVDAAIAIVTMGTIVEEMIVVDAGAADQVVEGLVVSRAEEVATAEGTVGRVSLVAEKAVTVEGMVVVLDAEEGAIACLVNVDPAMN